MSVDVQAAVGHGDPGSPGGPGTRPAHVVAVVVCHDGAEWLPRTLAALAGSTRRPDLVVAVDAGSRDRTPVVLDTAVGRTPVHVVDAVVTGDAHDGFGTSVARGLAAADRLRAESVELDAPAAGAPAAPGTGEQWVWLLHDDSAPEEDALAELLSVVQASPTLAVAGCKQRGWDDPRALVEVGATVSRGGRRLTDLGVGDIDQGQHDARGDVLLVSTAGMLVRRSVLDHVGGFDPAIPLVGDDVDLCLRVRRAGHRVAVVPTAVVRHVAALERGERPADALHGRLARRLGAPAPRAGRGGGLESARRRHWLHSRLVQAAPAAVPLLWLWVLAVTPVRALVWALRGRPSRAGSELGATARLVARGWRVTGSRWRSRRARAVPGSALRTLQRSRGQVVREDLDAWRARRSLRRREGTDDDAVALEALESGPVDEDTIALDLGVSGPARRFFGHPVTYLLPLVLLLGALPALRAATRPGPVDADGVAVAVEDPTAGLTAVELWSRATTGWRDVGTGVLGAADPATTVWAGLTGLVSVLRSGTPDAATLGDARTAVAVLAPALALLVAYPVARGLLRRRGTAAGAATLWALLPATGLLGEVHAGDLLVHALLPGLLAATLGCLGQRPVNALAATGLLSGLVVALSPGTWPVLVVVAVLVGVVGGSRVLASWRACLPLVGVAAPALLWAGWVSPARREPRALLLDPSTTDPTLVPLPTAAGLVDPALRARDVLAGRTGLLEDPAAVLAAAALALLGLAAVLAGLLVVAALARSRVPAAWCALATALVAAATGAAAVLAARATGTEPSVPASAAVLGLALAAVLGMRDVPARAAVTGARRVLLAVVRGAASTGRRLVPVAAVLTAAAVGLLVPTGPVPAGLPSAALVGAASPQATRTLLLGELDGAAGRGADAVLGWSVVAGQPGPGQASVQDVLAAPDRPVRAGDRRLADVVASSLGDGSVPGDEVAGALAELGVGWVVVAGRPDVDTALAQRAGLVRTAQAEDRTTWRVDSADAGTGPAPARARLVDADGADLGAVDLRGGSTELPAGEPGRVLVLADTARSSWSAELDGAALSRTTVDGWAQGFLLPADGGTLEVVRPGLPPAWGVVAPAALAVLVLALLWPGRRHRARLDLDRLPLPAPAGSRTSRGARAAGRAVLATAATGVVLLLLVGATGVGLRPGAVRADDLLPGGLGDRLAAPVEGLLDRVPRPDPVAAAPVVRLAAAGTLQTCPAPGPLDDGVEALDADAPGGEVRGLTVQTVRTGDDRGLRVAACPRTATSSWVLLGSTGVGQEPRLLLANPGETGAVVDVRLGGPSGRLVTPASTGILVGPGEQAEVAVDALAPDQDAVLAHVVARVGTVAVSSTGSALAGLVPLGGGTQPAETAPSSSLVLPWATAPGEAGEARLLVGSVGDTPAVVQVRVVPAAEGAAAADDLPDDLADDLVAGAPTEPVVAPAGGVVDVDLSGLAAGDYAVHLTSDVPVVASWTRTQQRGGEPAEGLTGVPVDRSWVEAVPAGSPWRSAVVLPLEGLLGEPGAVEGSTLGLLAGDETAGRARVAVLDADGGELGSRPVDLPSGGAPVGLPLPSLLDGLDPAQVASLAVTSATGVHVGLEVAVPDPDGELVAGTSVPGPRPPSTQVRLVRDR